jgi:L-2,4-diaminobutyric acid acetyltransferase
LSTSNNIELSLPTLSDGMAVFRLVENSPPLDGNSSYCNFLQCSHFANTSVAAKDGDTLVGFVSAYVIPERPNTLFVWQVAVSEQARGLGLASSMIAHILGRISCQDVRYIETSITQDNQASWALFRRLAKTLSTELQASPWMDKDTHFSGQHESESLVRIGPFTHNS